MTTSKLSLQQLLRSARDEFCNRLFFRSLLPQLRVMRVDMYADAALVILLPRCSPDVPLLCV